MSYYFDYYYNTWEKDSYSSYYDYGYTYTNYGCTYGTGSDYNRCGDSYCDTDE